MNESTAFNVFLRAYQTVSATEWAVIALAGWHTKITILIREAKDRNNFTGEMATGATRQSISDGNLQVTRKFCWHIGLLDLLLTFTFVELP